MVRYRVHLWTFNYGSPCIVANSAIAPSAGEEGWATSAMMLEAMSLACYTKAAGGHRPLGVRKPPSWCERNAAQLERFAWAFIPEARLGFPTPRLVVES